MLTKEVIVFLGKLLETAENVEEKNGLYIKHKDGREVFMCTTGEIIGDSELVKEVKKQIPT